MEPGLLVICFKKDQEFFYNQISQKEVVAQIAELVHKYWGQKYQVDVRVLDGVNMSPKAARDAVINEEEQVLREKIDGHPLIREIKTVLNATITGIKESP